MLFILKRVTKVHYDENESFVIRARSHVHARKIASQWNGDEGSETWLNPQLSSCKQLKNDGVYGVVIRNYKAG
jgi:hypothetical protein